MFVVEVAGLEAVVQLAEEFVEQVSLGLAVPVSGGAAGVVVAARTWGVAHGGQRADRADRGQAAVLDVAVQHHGFLAAGGGDRGGSGAGLQTAGVGETGAVVATCRQARRSFKSRQRRKNTGITWQQTRQDRPPVTATGKPIPTKRLGKPCRLDRKSPRF